MKGQGIFRGIQKAVAGLFSKTKHYPDPVFRELRDRPEGKRKFEREAKPTVAPPCDPGTITYHDKLVRHFGRRRADGYNECIQRKMMSALPTPEEFDAAVPWAWRS